MTRAASLSDPSPRVRVEYRDAESLSAIRENPRNARSHPEAQVAQIAALIEEFGDTVPLLVRGETGVLIAGHGRKLALERLGRDRARMLWLFGLTDLQAERLALADNRVALNSGWDQAVLRDVLAEIGEAGDSLEALGFGAAELDSLFADEKAVKVAEVDVADVADRFWISVRGPLERQADAFARLSQAMADLPGVEVEHGVIALD